MILIIIILAYIQLVNAFATTSIYIDEYTLL